MNIETRALKTRAETDLASQYEALRASAGASVALRDKAFALFEAKGLPHRRVEEYKYSDLRAHLKSAAAPAAVASLEQSTASLAAAEAFAGVDRFRVVLDNGRLVAGLSDLEALAREGVGVTDVALLLEDEARARGVLSAPALACDDVSVALNTAFLQGGVAIAVGEGASVSKPVEIVHLASGEGARYSRVEVSLGTGAKFTLIESFAPTASSGEVNAVSNYMVGDEAELTTARLVAGGDTHVSSIFLTLGTSSRVKTLGFNVGTGFARTQSFVSFTGEHADADLLGITMLRGKGHGDQTLVVDHAVPHCNSRELFKAVVDGQAEAVFQGKIIVRPHAQKTDGRMMTQALLLSEEASMANKPELEIFADDVQCAHGATSGQIDEDLLFYLRARGIPETEARALLVLAFLAEAVEELGDEAIVAALEERVRGWLSVEA
ncbi:Fe-S cluster assembly protein SufD [Stappia sp. F7233]|uniref:Fe-S cluster assembly protein SufD n=1 Tax=Stappia albiluteola TaxID=2758565 RepID=A0A839AD30_9HYPH|nr:Fe-S cluster assembly protein SufD [Stappia albiluteola]MBA5776928.1 Fe-S cluster assembly protein SufD [Stappia albiluteola]